MDKVQSFQSRMDDMKSKYPDKIQKVTIMYGCDFKELLKSEEAKPFTESELFGKQFFSRLRVRDAFATNRQDLYKLSWSEEKFPEEKFHLCDMNSCYSYCLSAFEFPTRSYERMLVDRVATM